MDAHPTVEAFLPLVQALAFCGMWGLAMLTGSLFLRVK